MSRDRRAVNRRAVLGKHPALQRYLQRHIEPALSAPPVEGRWSNTLVVPAFDESPALLDRLDGLGQPGDRVLVILVLNRPDRRREHTLNEPLRRAVRALPRSAQDIPLYRAGPATDLLLCDLERERGATPSHQGVGLARKAGCDIALWWIAEGRIASDWIHTTDADATLPADYFDRAADASADTAAVGFPFYHRACGDPAIDGATARYELRLHHYVLGLEYAGSHYAHYTLGSCIAVRSLHYAMVRGFPRRAGAEDFYLLNKLAKVGAVENLRGECIRLDSRDSLRVPFGTGPAVRQLAACAGPEEPRLCYHPLAFEALRLVLRAAPALQPVNAEPMREVLYRLGLGRDLAQRAGDTLASMGWDEALDHCRRQADSGEGFLRHLHQWFDGFRTLKFIHGLRDGGCEDQPLSALDRLRPQFWPDGALPATDMDRSRRAILRYRGWTT